jgi:O-succinylbenzoate synthase
MPTGTVLRLEWRPYRFELARDMVTSQGAWSLRRGWLLRMETPEGRVGWGEAALLPTAIGAEEDRGRPRMPSGAAERTGTSDTGLPSCSGGIPQGTQTAGHGSNEDRVIAAARNALPASLERDALETLLPDLPAPLACALGMALAELDGLGSAVDGGWLTAPPSALLLPAGEAAIASLEEELRRLTPDPPIPADRADPGRSVEAAGTADPEAALLGPGETAQDAHDTGTSAGNGTASAFTVKWKVASGDDALEHRMLEMLLERLPHNGRLRLDANGGWKRATAWRWAERLAGEARLDWFEQPLPPDDQAGLEELARLVPVALDESLRLNPSLVKGGWGGWQVRRPLAEADPRPLLAALRAGTPRLMLSTALETGIGRRFLHHLAGLQALGPTPTAPGLAPGWRPRGELFALQPETVWKAAG